MNTTYQPTVYEKSITAVLGHADDGLVVEVEADTRRQHSGECCYTIRFETSDSAFAGEDAVAISFSGGDLERGLIVAALRLAADQLTVLGARVGPACTDPAARDRILSGEGE